MIYDSNLIFSNNQAITTTAASTNTIDLQGGLSINVGPNATVLGEDIGIGDGVAIPKVAAFVTTAMTSSGGTATLQVALQYSADDGTNEPTGNPAAWVTALESDTYTTAQLAQGAKIAAFDWPQAQLNNLELYRFLRLNYTVASGPFTAGKVFAGLVLQRQDNNIGLYPSGFKVGP